VNAANLHVPARTQSTATARLARGPRLSSALGWRLAALAAVALGVLAAQSCEVYVPIYQTQPLFDWWAARPSQDQAVGVPDARSLAEGVFAVRPDWRTMGETSFAPMLAPPQVFQRTFAGERDGWTVKAASPAGEVTIEWSLAVFHQAQQARAWTEMEGMEEDTGRPNDLGAGRRTSGPGSVDVWVSPPHASNPPAGAADVVVDQGVVAVQLKLVHHGQAGAADSDPVAQAALAENDARSLVADWLAWYSAGAHA
jgi:hypothetical protein